MLSSISSLLTACNSAVHVPPKAIWWGKYIAILEGNCRLDYILNSNNNKKAGKWVLISDKKNPVTYA